MLSNTYFDCNIFYDFNLNNLYTKNLYYCNKQFNKQILKY